MRIFQGLIAWDKLLDEFTKVLDIPYMRIYPTSLILRVGRWWFLEFHQWYNIFTVSNEFSIYPVLVCSFDFIEYQVALRKWALDLVWRYSSKLPFTDKQIVLLGPCHIPHLLHLSSFYSFLIWLLRELVNSERFRVDFYLGHCFGPMS